VKRGYDFFFFQVMIRVHHFHNNLITKFSWMELLSVII